MGPAFSTKFLFGTKVQNSVFRNVSKLGLCSNFVTLNIAFNSDESLEILKSTGNVNTRCLE